MYLCELLACPGARPGTGLQGRMIILVLAPEEPLPWSPQWLHQLTFPPAVWERSLLCTPSPAWATCSVILGFPGGSAGKESV